MFTLELILPGRPLELESVYINFTPLGSRFFFMALFNGPRIYVLVDRINNNIKAWYKLCIYETQQILEKFI